MAATMHSYGGSLKVHFTINTGVRDVLRKQKKVIFHHRRSDFRADFRNQFLLMYTRYNMFKSDPWLTSSGNGHGVHQLDWMIQPLAVYAKYIGPSVMTNANCEEFLYMYVMIELLKITDVS